MTGVPPSALRDRIAYWVEQGYSIHAQTPTSARLVRAPWQDSLRSWGPKTIPGLSYAGFRDDSVEISIDAECRIHEVLGGDALITNSGLHLQPRVIAILVAAVVLLIWVARQNGS